MKFIDPYQGVFFKRGIAEFFMAFRDGKPVGTICCADDRETNAVRGLKDRMIGFFECVSDELLAQALFDHACTRALAHGLVPLYGPINLDYEDGYGVLIKGRERPPFVLRGHTFPFYQGFFEKYGFLPAGGITWDMRSPSQWRRMK